MIEPNTIICGDALEIMREIPDGNVDMILQDPPYNTTACSWEWDIMTKIEEFWAQWKRIIKPNGSIVMMASQPFTSKMVLSNLKMFKYELIWLKEQGNQPQLCNIQPMKAHENVLVFGNGKLLYNPQFTNGKPYNKREQTCVIKAKHLGRTAFKGLGKTNETKRYPISYRLFNCDRNGLFPTPKPVALFEYLIRTYTNEGDTIFDGFLGSGTTAVAAIRTGRRFIGIEIDETYCMLARKRIAAELAQLRLAL